MSDICRESGKPHIFTEQWGTYRSEFGFMVSSCNNCSAIKIDYKWYEYIDNEWVKKKHEIEIPDPRPLTLKEEK